MEAEGLHGAGGGRMRRGRWHGGWHGAGERRSGGKLG